jgi:hypothetical protein
MSRFISAAGTVAAPASAALTVAPIESPAPSPGAAVPSPLRGEFANSPPLSQPSNGNNGGDPAGTAALWALAMLLIIALIEARAFFKLRRQK